MICSSPRYSKLLFFQVYYLSAKPRSWWKIKRTVPFLLAGLTFWGRLDCGCFGDAIFFLFTRESGNWVKIRVPKTDSQTNSTQRLPSLTCNFTWARIVDRNMMLAAAKLLIKHGILLSTYIRRENKKLNSFFSVMCFAMRLVYVST